jgi:hypothetical protein
MEYSQTAQMNGPATIGEKRNRHVVLELANGTSVQKLLIGLLVAPLEASCGPVQSKASFVPLPSSCFRYGGTLPSP